VPCTSRVGSKKLQHEVEIATIKIYRRTARLYACLFLYLLKSVNKQYAAPLSCKYEERNQLTPNGVISRGMLKRDVAQMNVLHVAFMKGVGNWRSPASTQ